MSKGKIAGNGPVQVQLEEGKTYAWCKCGESSNQPWCDGSHRSTEHTPVVFQATETKEAWMCMCKQTDSPSFCDGTHSKL